MDSEEYVGGVASLLAVVAATGGSALGLGQAVQVPLWVFILLVLASPRDIWELIRVKAGLKDDSGDNTEEGNLRQ